MFIAIMTLLMALCLVVGFCVGVLWEMGRFDNWIRRQSDLETVEEARRGTVR